MTTVLLVIHLIIALALVGVVLLQRSEGGRFGWARRHHHGRHDERPRQRQPLTRTTAFLAAGFMVMSLLLAVVASGARAPTSILDGPNPFDTIPLQAPATPAEPAVPAAPLAD
jgi:preprotein translocase subunit SecG